MFNRFKCNYVNWSWIKKKVYILILNLFIYSSCVYIFFCDVGDIFYLGICSRDLIFFVKNG